MSRLRKLFIHERLVELCFRTEEGLPFVACPLIRYAMESIIARAQTYFPTHICSNMLMSNHIHMLVVIDDPAACPDFVGYIKRESAHMINRILGRRQHTVWQEGYDSTHILDAETAIRRFIYSYTNPSQANLVDTIDEYPNLTTWESFLAGGSTEVRNRIGRETYPTVPRRSLNLKEHEQLLADVLDSSKEDYELKIEPDYWLRRFEETRTEDPESIKRKIIDGVRQKEALLRQTRTTPVKGALALKLESFHSAYIPQKVSKRTICLSACSKRRAEFINWAKAQFSIARSVYMRWKGGDFTVLFPPGLFPPGGILRANLNPQFILF